MHGMGEKNIKSICPFKVEGATIWIITEMRQQSKWPLHNYANSIESIVYVIHGLNLFKLGVSKYITKILDWDAQKDTYCSPMT